MQNVQMPVWAAIILALGIAFIGAAGAVGAQIVSAQKELRRLKITSAEAHSTLIRQERKEVYARLIHEIEGYTNLFRDIEADTNLPHLGPLLKARQDAFDKVGAEVMLVGSRIVTDQFIKFATTIGPTLSALAEYARDSARVDNLNEKNAAFSEESATLRWLVRTELRIPYDE